MSSVAVVTFPTLIALVQSAAVVSRITTSYPARFASGLAFQSSVVKFTQKLGFKGYPDLKYSVGEAIARADNGDATHVATQARAAFDEILKGDKEIPSSKIGDAVMAAHRFLILQDGHAHGIDAERRRQAMAQMHVGGGKAHGAASRIAMLDTGFHRPETA